jgi:hypothetical protein
MHAWSVFVPERGWVYLIRRRRINQRAREDDDFWPTRENWRITCNTGGRPLVSFDAETL